MRRRELPCELLSNFRILVLIFLASPVTASVPELSVVDCANATHTCTSRTEKCGILYHTYTLGCAQELRGKTPQGLCLDRCRLDLITLSSMVEGYKLVTCKCEPDDSNCIIGKDRLSECWNDKINFTEYEFNNHSARASSCADVRTRCKENELCYLAYTYYGTSCRGAIERTAEPCNEQCAASARILYAVSNGYFTCDCQGEYWCLRENSLIGTKCFGNSSLKTQSALALILFSTFLSLWMR
ncbi:uncharacterized protein LOC100898178 [Galendromus occidentalis]|uniref:Uncharacterized protein LOC100898178 n=1 Tax=Galendromus occidentalis TaxID=34638 RepID=A0AAJ6QTI5_9ACAR|nr:uncharacterized protein LOC100898178 [Galendromus occidentalis]